MFSIYDHIVGIGYDINCYIGGELRRTFYNEKRRELDIKTKIEKDKEIEDSRFKEFTMAISCGKSSYHCVISKGRDSAFCGGIIGECQWLDGWTLPPNPTEEYKKTSQGKNIQVPPEEKFENPVRYTGVKLTVEEIHKDTRKDQSVRRNK